MKHSFWLYIEFIASILIAIATPLGLIMLIINSTIPLALSICFSSAVVLWVELWAILVITYFIEGL